MPPATCLLPQLLRAESKAERLLPTYPEQYGEMVDRRGEVALRDVGDESETALPAEELHSDASCGKGRLPGGGDR
jgi:hypothetical protein